MRSQLESDSRSCNLCGSTQARELYTAKDHLSNSEEEFSICECLGCGVLRTSPAMGSAELARYYPADYWGEVSVPSQK